MMTQQILNEFNATMVSVVLEVAAEDRHELGNKLYGCNEFEAKCELVGYDPEEMFEEYEREEAYRVVNDEMRRQRYDRHDVEEVQDNLEKVYTVLDAAVFNSHPVMFRANGQNIGSPSEMTQIPYFNYDPDSEAETVISPPSRSDNVYRTDGVGDLILQGTPPAFKLTGFYKLRSDVGVKIHTVHQNPDPGRNEATPLE